MNKNRKKQLALIVLGGLIVGTNLYWRQRCRHLRKYLTTSQEWEKEYTLSAETKDAELTRTSVDKRTTTSTLAVAAKKAGTTPSELPKRIDELQQQFDEAQKEAKSARKNWSRWWVERYINSADSGDESDATVNIVVANLNRGCMEDSKWLGKNLLEESNQIGLISAGGDQAFVIVVSNDLTDRVTALNIAEDVAEQIGGGAGGDEVYASGGGGNAEQILSALQHTADSLRDELVNPDEQ